MTVSIDAAPRVGPRQAIWRQVRRKLPQRADYAGLSTSWRGDVLAGITVGVVALPLALAFGLSTGVGATVGLVTAIVAGLVVAVFGGSHLQVSGPTGAMTAVLVPVVAHYGPGAVTTVAALAGILVLLMGIGGFGRALSYIPWPVIEGFTLGIAVIIFLQQVPFALDVPKPAGTSTAVVAWRALLAVHWAAAAQTLTLVILVGAVMLVLPRWRRTLPASLIAVAVVTVVAELFHLSATRIGQLPASLPMPVMPHLDIETVQALLPSALAVAALAAIESLLSARVADGMSDTAPHDSDRELVGQGLGSFASGLFGGMPATGAIARTAVAVRAGARTRLSAIVHALLLVGVVYLGSSLVARIPLAALAGVLMVTALRMVERHSVLSVLRSTRGDALVLVLTAGATVVFDLVIAVEVGMVVAVLLALRSMARSSEVHTEQIPDGEHLDDADEHRLLREHIAVYRLTGALFFGAAQRFLDELTSVADVKVVILRLGAVQIHDATGAKALGEIVANLQNRGTTVLLCGVDPEKTRLLTAVGALRELAHSRHVFTSMDAAVAHAGSHVRRESH